MDSWAAPDLPVLPAPDNLQQTYPPLYQPVLPYNAYPPPSGVPYSAVPYSAAPHSAVPYSAAPYGYFPVYAPPAPPRRSHVGLIVAAVALMALVIASGVVAVLLVDRAGVPSVAASGAPPASRAPFT